jgi:hypothetical protein
MEQYVLTQKTTARDWGQISFEVLGVWNTYADALEYLKELKQIEVESNKRTGDFETEPIEDQLTHAVWSYDDWDGIYEFTLEPVTLNPKIDE